MKTFTFAHDGEGNAALTKGLQVSTSSGNHIFLGQSGDGCKSYKLSISRDSMPDIEDGMVYDAFCTLNPDTERPHLIKTNRMSPNILLRINTICSKTNGRFKGKWFQTALLQEAICSGYGKGKSWVDSLLILRSGNSAIVTLEGGKKYIILNYSGRIICAPVAQQVFFDSKSLGGREKVKRDKERASLITT